MTTKAQPTRITELEQQLTWAFRDHSYRCQTIKDSREARFVFTHTESANRAWWPAGLVRQFEFIDRGGRLFFEIDGIRFEPGTQATSHAIEFAKDYLDSRVYPVKQRNLEETGEN